MTPLICLLCIVDCDERPSMGYVYEGMYRAHLGIKKLFKDNKRLYKSYSHVIKQRYCDTPNPRVPLTTRQPVKFLWISGDPIPH